MPNSSSQATASWSLLHSSHAALRTSSRALFLTSLTRLRSIMTPSYRLQGCHAFVSASCRLIERIIGGGFRTLESEWVATLMVLSACVAFIAVTCLLSSFTCPTLMVVVANLPFVSRKGHDSFGTRRWQTMWWNHILLMHPSHSRLDSLTEKDEHL